MNETVRKVVEVARSWNGQDSHTAGYGAYPFCASFVRYVFRTVLGEKGEMPVVPSPPYYRKLGLSFAAGKWYADSMAGDEVGPAIPPSQMQPGDLLFFRNTYPGWAEGTITHIGICLEHGGLMADAGSGGIVHVRDQAVYFPGLLVEVRRPKCLGTVAKRTSVTFENNVPAAMFHGAKAFQQEMQVVLDGLLHVSVNGKEIKPTRLRIEAV